MVTNKVKKIIPIVLSIFFLIWTSINVIYRDLDIDLFQHFANAHMLKEGAVPYRDYNVLTPPLLQLIAAPFLLIYDDVLTLKVLNIIAGCVLAFVTYKTYNQLNDTHKTANLILALALSSVIASQTLWGYNLTNVIFNAIAIYFLLKMVSAREVAPKYVVALALDCALSLLTKQSTGLTLTAGVGLSLIYLVVKYKEPLKLVISKVIIFFSVYAFILTVICSWLIFNSAFDDFIDQTIFGVSTFDKSGAWKSIIAILAAITVIALFYFILFRKKAPEQSSVVCIVALSSLSSLYPILNLWHTTNLWYMGTLMVLIFFNIIPAEEKSYATYILSLITGVILIFNGVYFSKIIQFRYFEEFYTDIPYMNGVYYYSNLKNTIQNVNKYINEHPENEYRIISSYAVMFDLPREDTFIKYYDMILKGNMGTVDPYEMVVNDSDKYYFIICDDRDGYAQMDQRIYEYIIDSGKFELVDTLKDDMYSRPYEVYLLKENPNEN